MEVGSNNIFNFFFNPKYFKVDTETMEPTEKLSSAARDWVQEQGSRATTVQEVLEGPDVAVMRGIQAGIDKANKQAVSNAQRIQKWMIIPKDFRWVFITDHHSTINIFSGHPYPIHVLNA